MTHRNDTESVLQLMRTNPDHEWTTAEMHTHLDPGYGFALNLLKERGLVVRPERATWRLTEKGKTADPTV